MTSLSVLVVEDDLLLGFMLGEVLKELGYEICAIEATEDDAIYAAAHYRPDLMIIDVFLKVGSGISAAARICEAGFIPHIFMTGDYVAAKYQKPGAITIQKPFTENDLLKAIQQALLFTYKSRYNPAFNTSKILNQF